MRPYYQDQSQTIYHGDCRDILPQLGIFDLVLTDPPYGVNLRYHNYIDTPENLRKLISETFPVIRRAGIVILLTPGVTNIFRYPEPDWILCWRSGAGTSSGKWGFTTWQPILAYGKDPYYREGYGGREDSFVDNCSSEKNIHPCPKPLRVWKWILLRGAPRSSDRILDPFLGSGTTLLAAKQLGLAAVGIDISERYCELSAKRLSQGHLFEPGEEKTNEILGEK